MRHQQGWIPVRLVRIVPVVAVLSATVASGACDSMTRPSTLPNDVPSGPVGGSGASGPTGSYALTVTASSSCANVTDAVTGQTVPFPDSVRERRYTAEFANGAATVKATDGTRNEVKIGGTDSFSGPGL